MQQTNFISHAQVIPPGAPSRGGGIGLLSVLAITVAVLSGALSGGLWFVQNYYKNKVIAATGRLEEIQRKTQIASLERVKSLQDRIEMARTMLGEHIYPSRALNFVEKNMLEETQIHSFTFSDNVIKMQLTVPNFTVFAQQLKHFRSVSGAVSSLVFDQPNLEEKGEVTFTVSITLKDEYMRTLPDRDLPPPEEENIQ